VDHARHVSPWSFNSPRTALTRSGQTDIAQTHEMLRGVGDHWILKNNPMQSSRYPILSEAAVVLEDRTQITSEQVVQQLLAAELPTSPASLKKATLAIR
jgi:hypothetical protein